ncbi:hypothetical protein JOC94_004225 [Bacillus thermophilus]|uniref:Uncharacterized protein n=1 Tax=Siminovitchia thermophila TaxID=1245522 RepID=A0ABS2RCU5_9BACI|nr:hypothetical protein [Siminovitchia thermophila]MBM7717200.1 hypothetical protein [Siminovitchia thermophila]
MIFFSEYNKTIKVQNPSKGVESIEVALVIDDVQKGTANITDFMLQGGRISTVWVYHPTEIRWSHDG